MNEPVFAALTIRTPAKINFYLFIQSKRTDGYHELIMDLVPISLFDCITFSPTNSKSLVFSSNIPEVEKESNLIVKAIRLLEKECGKKIAVKIDLTKSIPSGAGLGGGSGNAAGTLVVINKLFGLNIPDQTLQQLALKLGADIPFFLNPKPSLAKGIGERLTALQKFDPIHIILVYPGFPIATKKAYSVCHKSGRKELLSNYSLSEFKDLQPDVNDFWLPLKEIYPQLKVCQETILNQGAIFSGLSGSGSTIFGIFPDKATRDKAFSSLGNCQDWSVFKCKTLPAFCYL